jgi:hypothetical protein
MISQTKTTNREKLPKHVEMGPFQGQHPPIESRHILRDKRAAGILSFQAPIDDQPGREHYEHAQRGIPQSYRARALSPMPLSCITWKGATEEVLVNAHANFMTELAHAKQPEETG